MTESATVFNWSEAALKGTAEGMVLTVPVGGAEPLPKLEDRVADHLETVLGEWIADGMEGHFKLRVDPYTLTIKGKFLLHNDPKVMMAQIESRASTAKRAIEDALHQERVRADAWLARLTDGAI